MALKVKATQKGYYDHEMKMPGEVFFLTGGEAVIEEKDKDGKPTGKTKRVRVSPEQQFSDKWMEKCDKGEEVKAHQHGAPKGDGVDVQKFNPATSDNAKPLAQIKAEHGPRGGDKGGDVI